MYPGMREPSPCAERERVRVRAAVDAEERVTVGSGRHRGARRRRLRHPLSLRAPGNLPGLRPADDERRTDDPARVKRVLNGC